MGPNLQTKNIEKSHLPNIEEGHLKRTLKQRHMTMIAIGGAIGTGLFVSSGASISSAGPGGTLLVYTVIGIMVYFLMTSLGEMATYLPVTGSFSTYAGRFIDSSMGFALGWNYWYYLAITVAVEVVASAIVMNFWFPEVSSLFWSILFLAILSGLNFLSAKVYGESEFWFASIKVAAIIAFLIAGTLMIFGIMGGEAVGFKNFTIGEAPFVGGFSSIMAIFMIAGFSFQGTELVGITAGESENPERDVPKAINSVFWRILLFYIGAIIVISCIIPYNDPNLLNSSVENVVVSPFTLVFNRAGLAFAASVMNAVILTSVLSCGNSCIYGASRILYGMAKDGNAPKIFQKVNSRGVPVNALVITILIGSAAFISSLWGEGKVYIWLLNASGLAGFIMWLGIAMSHYRFRKAYTAQGRDLNKLIYKAKWYPFGPVFSAILCVIVIIGQNYTAFMGETIDWYGILVSYIGLPIFIAFYAYHKTRYKTKLIPLDEVDFDTKG